MTTIAEKEDTQNNYCEKIYNYVNQYFKTDDEMDISALIATETTYKTAEYRDIITRCLNIKNEDHYFIKELEIFDSNNNAAQQNTLFNIINKTKTTAGELKLRSLITSPTADIKILNLRKELITTLDKPTKYEYMASIMSRLASKDEYSVLWFIKGLTPEMKNLTDMIYFNSFWNSWANYNSNIMEFYFLFIAIYPFISALMPIVMMCIPLILLYYMFGTPFSLASMYKALFYTSPQFKFITVMLCRNSNTFLKILGYMLKYGILKLLYILITVFMYFCGVINSYKIATTHSKILNMMHSKLHGVKRYIDMANSIYAEFGSLFGHLPRKLPSALEHINNPLFNKESTYFTNRGVMSLQFLLLKESPDVLYPYIDYLSTADMWFSVVSLKRMYSMVLPQYIIGSDRPILELTDFYNLAINKTTTHTVVKNTIDIGKVNTPRNMVITGANASGKSTTMKAIICGVLLAQTICVVPARVCSITPFKLLNTYLNIPDCNGRESLYQAEMTRCNELINKISGLDGYSLTIMDEIFVSTNYYEGLAGAYGVCKKMGAFPNSICIVSTHYPLLAKLCKKAKTYSPYYFNTKCSPEGIITNTYKMNKGFNKTHIALELMKQNNFDPEIIKDAIKLYKYLIKRENSLTPKKTIPSK